jgi:1-acyl-sn-glycerol-3-phosphate acyltransferase
MSAPYSVSYGKQIVRKVLRFFFRILYWVFSRVLVTGKENIPKSGAYIIAFNHVSLFEAPLIVAFWSKEVEAAGAADLWERPGIAILVSLYGGIRVHRGEYDRELIKDVIHVLKSGTPVIVAPEGTRSHCPGMQKAHPGISYIADLANVPIIPVGIVGSTEDFLTNAIKLKRPNIEMHIGEPFKLPPLVGKGAQLRQARQKNADLVMQKIALLLPPNYQGYYQKK